MKGFYGIIHDHVWPSLERDAALPDEKAYARRLLLSGGHGEEVLAALAADHRSAEEVLRGLRERLDPNGSGCGGGRVGTDVHDRAYNYAINRDGIVAFFGDEPERWHWLPGSGYGSFLGPIHPRLHYTLGDVPAEKVRGVRVRLAEIAREAVERHAQPSLLECT